MTRLPPPPSRPEAHARVRIDAAFAAAGWVVQNRDERNLPAALGVAIREFKRKTKHGYADYLVFVDGKAVSLFEAKEAGHTLTGVEPQSAKYAAGLPAPEISDDLRSPPRPDRGNPRRPRRPRGPPVVLTTRPPEVAGRSRAVTRSGACGNFKPS
jgi:hypothetical protein